MLDYFQFILDRSGLPTYLRDGIPCGKDSQYNKTTNWDEDKQSSQEGELQ